MIPSTPSFYQRPRPYSERVALFPFRAVVLRRWSDTFRLQTASLTRMTPSIRSRRKCRSAWGYEIKGITRQLVAAKSQWNAHTLPCLLPTEILADIFEICKETEDLDEQRYLPYTIHRRSYPGWFKVTKVCRHFRTVALGHAVLWTTLSAHIPPTWKLFLTRSLSAPLDVRADTRYMHESRFLPLILDNVGRIRVLSILGRDSQITTSSLLINLLEEQGLPLLEGLTLAWQSGGYTLSDDFLRRRAPRLRSLELRGVGMSWHSTSPLSLRTLTLARAPITYSWEDVFAGLRNMPMLESLTIDGSLFADKYSGGSTVVLPRLGRLRLYNTDGNEPLDFWLHIRMHPSCDLKFTFGWSSVTTETYAKVVAATHKHLSQPSVPTYTKLILGCDTREDGTLFRVAMLAAPYPSHDVDESMVDDNDQSYSNLTLASHIDRRNTELELSVATLFPAEPVRILVLNKIFMGAREPAVIDRLFRRFPGVDTLELVGSETAGRILTSIVETTFTPDQPLYLPSLTTLSFKEVDFDSRLPDRIRAQIPGIDRSACLYDLLRLALQRRARQGARIQALMMSYCFAEEDVSCVETCRPYVDSLQWEVTMCLEETWIEEEMWVEEISEGEN